MRKALMFIVSLAIVLTAVGTANAQCTKIQSGTLVDSKGAPITLGYDQYGYNYQAHMFNGLYDNYTRPIPSATEGPVNLMMKWSNDWLANQDCNGDGKLDRGLNAKTGVSTGVSMGWLTNHMEGDCYTPDGESIHATYFTKIVWVGPAPVAEPDPWAGKRIWGIYAIIEEVGEDPSGGVCLGLRGLRRGSLVNPAGFGAY